MLLLFTMFAASGAQAAINFNEVALGTTDPTISGVSFWAGDPSMFLDTITGDSWSIGNAYLMNGFDDGTGKSPGFYDTFIGANPTSGLFGTVDLDVLSEYSLPGGTTFWLQGSLGGVLVEGTSLAVSDNAYHDMYLAFANGADKLYIYDNLGNGFGSSFHIDNFNATPYDDGGHQLPEPSTLMLLAMGLVGAWSFKKRNN